MSQNYFEETATRTRYGPLAFLARALGGPIAAANAREGTRA